MCQGFFASYSRKKSPTWVATGMTDNAKIYGLDLDLEVISWSFVHHFIALRQLCGIDHNKSTTGGNNWYEARKYCQTDGCTAEIPATCEAKILIEGTKNVNHLEYGFRN